MKVLNAAAEGEACSPRGKALPGSGTFVQATDGTRGYVFSNTQWSSMRKEGTTRARHRFGARAERFPRSTSSMQDHGAPLLPSHDR